MVCTTISNLKTIGDYLVYPTGCNYWFYLWIFGAIFLVLVMVMYRSEKLGTPKPDMLSILGVNSIGMIVISGIGTLIENTDGIPMIQDKVLAVVLAVSIPLIIIWLFKK